MTFSNRGQYNIQLWRSQGNFAVEVTVKSITTILYYKDPCDIQLLIYLDDMVTFDYKRSQLYSAEEIAVTFSYRGHGDFQLISEVTSHVVDV